MLLVETRRLFLLEVLPPFQADPWERGRNQMAHKITKQFPAVVNPITYTHGYMRLSSNNIPNPRGMRPSCWRPQEAGWNTQTEPCPLALRTHHTPDHELARKRPRCGVRGDVEVRQPRQQRGRPLAGLGRSPRQGDDELGGGALAEADDIMQLVAHPLQQLPVAHAVIVSVGGRGRDFVSGRMKGGGCSLTQARDDGYVICALFNFSASMPLLSAAGFS